MTVDNWLTRRFTKRGKALSLYKRGMARAKKHDHQGAIDYYTTTIGMQETPFDVKAMALYNRALALVASGDDPRGVDDLKLVLSMDESLVNVKTMCRQKLARIESQSRKSNA